MAAGIQKRLVRMVVAGAAVFLLTAQAVMPTPMPGEAPDGGAQQMIVPDGLVCTDDMATTPYNDDQLVIEAALVDGGCQVPQSPIHI